MKRIILSGACFLLAANMAGANLWTEGLARMQSGDYEGAAADLEAFARGNPTGDKAPHALFLAGDLHESLGRDSDAMNLYDRVVKEYGTGPWVLKSLDHLAELHRKRKEWEASAEALVRFIEVYLETRGDTVAGPPVQDAIGRIVDCRRKMNSSRSREDVLRSLVAEYDDHPIRDAIMAAEGGRFLPPGSNLLRNPGFEWDREGQILPPVGWEYLGTEPEPGDDADGTLNTSIYPMTEPRSGRFCAGKFTSYGSHRGWFLQTIPVERGREYECFAFGCVRGQKGATGRLRVGVDPTGGVDPGDEAVLWSDYVSPFDDYARLGFSSGATVRALGESLTIFLEVRQDDIRPDNAMLFDDACARLAGESE